MAQKTTTVYFYTSAICPRCRLAARTLEKLGKCFPGLQVEQIDVVAHPLRAWQDGVRLIPALRAEDRIISGLFLDTTTISSFLEQLRLRRV